MATAITSHNNNSNNNNSGDSTGKPSTLSTMSHNHHHFHPTTTFEADASRSLELSASETSLEFSSSSLVKGGEDVVLAPAESVTGGDVAKKKDSDSSFHHCGEEEEFSILFWELLLYIPVLLVQSVFGTFHIFRSLVLGHALRWFFQRQEQHPWEAAIHRHMERNAWPPPGLVFLAVLTVTALIVHPDGFTWVILRKIRSAIMSLFRASCSCWSMLLHEHGAIISTCLALATFVSLFFLAYVLHKTLSPRKHSVPKSLKPVKKKKRKRGHRASGRSTRTTQQHQRPNRSKSRDRDNSNEIQTDSDPRSGAAKDDAQSATANQPALPAVLEDIPVEPSKQQQEELITSSLGRAASRVRTMSASSVEESIASASVEGQSWDDGRSTPVPLALPLSCTTSPTTTATSPTSSLSTTTVTTSEARTRNYRPRAPRRTPSNSNTRKNQNRRRGGASGGTGSVTRKTNEPKQRSPQFHRAKMGAERSPRAPTAVLSPPRIASLAMDHSFKTQFPAASIRQPSLNNSTAPAAPVQATPAIRVEPRVEPMSQRHQPQPAAYYHHSTPARSLPPPPPGLSPIPQFEQSPLVHFGTPNHHQHQHQQQQRQYNVEQSSGVSLPPNYYQPYVPSPPPAHVTDQHQHRMSPPMQQQNQQACFASSKKDSHAPLLPPQSPLPSVMTTKNDMDNTFEFESRKAPSRVRANPFASEDIEIPVGAVKQDTEDDRIEAELQELGGRIVGSILDF